MSTDEAPIVGMIGGGQLARMTAEAATAARRARFDYVQGAGLAPAMPVHGKVFSV